MSHKADIWDVCERSRFIEMPDEAPDPEQIAMTREAVALGLAALREREAHLVVALHVYGETLEVQGKRIGVGRERVRQISAKALRTARIAATTHQAERFRWLHERIDVAGQTIWFRYQPATSFWTIRSDFAGSATGRGRHAAAREREKFVFAARAIGKREHDDRALSVQNSAFRDRSGLGAS